MHWVVSLRGEVNEIFFKIKIKREWEDGRERVLEREGGRRGTRLW